MAQGMRTALRERARFLCAMALVMLLSFSGIDCAAAVEAAVPDASDSQDAAQVFADGVSDTVDEKDIAEQWQREDPNLREEGVYYLSADVHTEYGLSVCAPEGKTITVDFRGHSVFVSGKNRAVITITGAKGSVKLIDSLYEKGEGRASYPTSLIVLQRECFAEDVPWVRTELTSQDAAVQSTYREACIGSVSAVTAEQAKTRLEEWRTHHAAELDAVASEEPEALESSVIGIVLDAAEADEAALFKDEKGEDDAQAVFPKNVVFENLLLKVCDKAGFAQACELVDGELKRVQEECAQPADGAAVAEEEADASEGVTSAREIASAASGAPDAEDASMQPAEPATAEVPTQTMSTQMAASDVAVLIDPSGVEAGSFASVEQAFEEAQPGSTVKILVDSGTAVIAKQAEQSDAYTLDLNGHQIAGLIVSGNAQVSVVSSDARGAIFGSLQLDNTQDAAVSYSGSGALAISNCDIVPLNAAHSAYGIYATGIGALSLNDVAIDARRSYGTIYGVYQSSTKSAGLQMQDCQVGVTADRASVTAYGIFTQSGLVATRIEDCAISVCGGSSQNFGLDTRWDAALTNTRIEVSGCGSSPLVYGIRSRAQSPADMGERGIDARVYLGGCTVHALSADGISTGTYICLVSNNTLSNRQVEWVFDGTTDLQSAAATEVGQNAAPVRIGTAFANASSGKIGLTSIGLTDDLCLQAVEETTDISAHAAEFAAAAGSAYTGWNLGCPAGRQDELVWMRSDDIALVRSGTQIGTYSTLAAALQAAVAGDTLRLDDDCTEYAAFEIGTSLTLDLAGHEFSVSAGSRAKNAAALKCSGAAQLCITDSTATVSAAGSGLLSLQLGSSDEYEQGALYAGILLAGGSSVQVQGCTVKVAYQGASSLNRTVDVAGAVVEDGTFELTDHAQMQIESAGASAAYGALNAYGILLKGTRQSSLLGDPAETAHASIAQDSSVSVRSDTPLIERGAVSTSVDTSRSSTQYLMEVAIPQDSALYEEVQQKFKQYALFDSGIDSTGSIYGVNIYYAAPLVLDDGRYVWAFSDVVPADSLGSAEYIHADHFFMQAKYDEITGAYGIAGEGDADIQGTVSIASECGNAVALNATRGSWNVGAAAQVHASASTVPYRANTGIIDLRQLISGLDLLESPIGFYLSNVECYYIAAANPSAATEQLAGDATIQWDASAARSETQLQEEPEPLGLANSAFPQNVNVSFTGLRTAVGSSAAETTMQIPYGSSMLDAGVALPATADAYELAGSDIEYRFAGWINESSGTSRAWSSELLACTTFDITCTGAMQGQVVFRACYVPVRTGQRLVSFYVDGYVFSYAARLGDVPSYALADYGTTSEEPTKITRTTGYKYTFEGWIPGTSALARTAAVSGELPLVDDHVCYTATFSNTISDINIYLHAWQLGADSTTLYYMYKKVPCQPSADLDSSADDIAVAGDQVFIGDYIYTFKGWSTRPSDLEPLYTQGLPSVTAEEHYYGIYERADYYVDVRFYVDGVLYATAEHQPAATVVDSVLRASTNPQVPADKSEQQKFRGWALAADASAPIRGTIATIGSVAGNRQQVDLHALYGTQSSDENTSGSGTSGGSGSSGSSGSGSAWGSGGSSGSDGSAAGSGSSSAGGSFAESGGDAPGQAIVGDDQDAADPLNPYGGPITVGTGAPGAIVRGEVLQTGIRAPSSYSGSASSVLSPEEQLVWDEYQAWLEGNAERDGFVETLGIDTWGSYVESDTSESDWLAFALLVGLVVLGCGMYVFRLVRNRRLDAQDDLYADCIAPAQEEAAEDGTVAAMPRERIFF